MTEIELKYGCSPHQVPAGVRIPEASVAQAGGSLRDDEVTAAAEQYGMTMVHTGLRLFLR